MRTKIIAVALVVLVLTPFGAQSQPVRMTYGVGAKSCGSWTVARKSSNWFSEGEWLLGYVSGVNIVATTPTRKTDAEALLGWADNFCQANPLKDIDDAALALVVELGVAR